MTHQYRCVICLAKSGSSQVAKNFRQQGAIHEYDFKRIAEIAINRDIDREKILNYMINRKDKLRGKIDVSTSLLHICDKSMIKELNMRPIFLVRNPLDWISSMIKYAVKTDKTDELNLEGGWRKKYGKVFIRNTKIPFDELKSIEPTTIKQLTQPLMKSWADYTEKLYNMALNYNHGIDNIYSTESLGKIKTHTQIAKYYGLEDKPPLNFFLISNQTIDTHNVKQEIKKHKPTLCNINIESNTDIIKGIIAIKKELRKGKSNE